MLTYLTDSLVEWLTLPSLSQTAALLFFFERSVRPPRPPRSIVPWWGYGNAQRLRCFSQREQVGDPRGRRFTLCSCETITIMGYRAERSWGNARWAIGPRQKETELERERDRHLLYYRGNLPSKRMNFHHQTDSLYSATRLSTLTDTLITDVFLLTYYFNSSYNKLKKIKTEKRKQAHLKLGSYQKL